MKILYSLLLVLYITCVFAQVNNNCNSYLSKFKTPGKCVQLSIAGVHTESLAQEGYKGNLQYSNGSFKLINGSSIINLQTYETTCNRNGLIQPFSVDAQFKYNNFNIFDNGTIILNYIKSNLTCLNNDNIATFKSGSYHYNLVLRDYDQCPKLNYGELCNTPTQSPTNTPTQSPTQSPTNTPTSGPIKYKINYTLIIDNQWNTNGIIYYQYRVIITNDETSAIKSIQFKSDNWEAVQHWNINEDNNGTLTLSDYVVQLEVNGQYAFGFVSSNPNPTFTTISIQRV